MRDMHRESARERARMERERERETIVGMMMKNEEEWLMKNDDRMVGRMIELEEEWFKWKAYPMPWEEIAAVCA
jgi:hypothetical protein